MAISRKRFVQIALGGALAIAPDPDLLGGRWQTQAYAALAAAIEDPLAVLAARSPGERTAAALRQTKGRSAKYASALRDHRSKPTERVLSQARMRPLALARPGAVAFANALPPTAAGLLGPQNQLPQASTPAFAQSTPSAALADAPPLIGALPPTGLTTAPSPPAVLVPTPTSAVPEPATWIELIFGFGFVGIGLRRRRMVVAPAQADVSW